MRAEEVFDLCHTYKEVADAMGKSPWCLLDGIESLIDCIATRGLREGWLTMREAGVYVAPDAEIAKDAVICPPAIIGRGSVLRTGAYLRGQVILGEGCLVGHASEVKGSILFDGVKAPHFAYIGDSILGYRVHAGAGVIFSNTRLDAGQTVGAWDPPSSPRKKAGALVGDFVELGCHAVVNPGALIPRGSKILPLTSVRGGHRV